MMKLVTIENHLRRYHLEDNCWIWDGHIDRLGYGDIGGGTTKHIKAHRLFYEHHRGLVPIDMTLDHLCRNRRCVNPEHLEVVSLRVNIQRGDSPAGIRAKSTHCPQGHEYTLENTIVKVDSRYGTLGRECRTCKISRDFNRSR